MADRQKSASEIVNLPRNPIMHRVQSKHYTRHAPRAEQASRPPSREERENYLRAKERQHLKRDGDNVVS